MYSCQVFQQASSLSCLDRKRKTNLSFENPPPHQHCPTINFILRNWTRKHCCDFFFESSEELTVPLFMTSLNLEADTHCSSHLGPSARPSHSGSCLTKEGPCLCLYGLPECPRTFVVIFNKRGFTYSLP